MADTELKTKLQNILNEKGTKLLPENIKKDITILGVTGTFEGGGSGDVKLFNTVEEMRADSSKTEGDLAVVYENELHSVADDTEFRNCLFPDTVVLPEAFSSSVQGEFVNIPEAFWADYSVSLTSSTFSFTGYTAETGNYLEITYTSQDGITYTRTDGGEELPNLETTVVWDSNYNFNDTISNFMKVPVCHFDGIYICKYVEKNNEQVLQYVLADTQLDTSAEYVYQKTFYGQNGIEAGTLANSISNSFSDIPAEIYAKAQSYYNTLTPRVLTDNDKTINTSVKVIPCKSDGTPLLDTSSVTDMSDMFCYCYYLTSIPLLDTSNVTDMSRTFKDCNMLTSIPLLDTSNTTNMEETFSGCVILTTIPLLDTSSVTNMEDMFKFCFSLISVPLLDTSSVTEMYRMFTNCMKLSNTSLNNILAMCTNATNVTTNKTLEYIGLSQTQAETCTTLSNYQAFINAGWTTGY